MTRWLAAVLLAGVMAATGSAAVPTPQQLSADAFTTADAQHATAVEPDSFAVGNSVVAVFQVGRRAGGGASGIGYATSHDGGHSWTRGLLPIPIGPGSLTFASDPAIAYDRTHATWVASVLGGRVTGQGLSTSLLAARSSDGVSWETSFTVSDTNTALHDKNWIACDNGVRSPRAGRCYVVWSAPLGNASVLGLSTSDDGGRTWTPSRVFERVGAFGVYPLVRANGTLVVLYATADGTATLEAVSSTDGGRTFGAPARIAALRFHTTPGLRAPPFHSAEITRDGRIFVAWPDCRYSDDCRVNDIVYSSSADGRRWTSPLRVPTGAALAGLDHVLPGLAVDPTTTGARASLALLFYALSPAECRGASCRLQPTFVSSPDGGGSWSAPEQLAEPAPIDWFPQAGARFAGDYMSTSFVAGGVAVPVFAWAEAPSGGRFHEGIYATAVPRLAAVRAVRLGTLRIRTARRLEVRAAAVPSDGARVTCRATARGRRVALLTATVTRSTATCIWRVTARARVFGSIVLTTPEGSATRRFAATVR